MKGEKIDKIKEYKKEYREKNIDKIKEYKKEYREKNKDKIKEYKKEHREKNKDKIKKYEKEYREKTKDKMSLLDDAVRGLLKLQQGGGENNCLIIREKIAKNVYYMRRAHEKFTGTKYNVAMKLLQKENNDLLNVLETIC